MACIKIIKGDITESGAEVIVNAANSSLKKGTGVCGAIYAKAGSGLEYWTDGYVKCSGDVNAGEVVFSPSFNLGCKYICHAVGPVYRNGHEFKNTLGLMSAYYNAIYQAQSLGCMSIAFPCISTGIYGYPISESIEVIKKILQDDIVTLNPTEIIFVCYSQEDYDLYRFELSGWAV